jgi:hypothetical protein
MGPASVKAGPPGWAASRRAVQTGRSRSRNLAGVLADNPRPDAADGFGSASRGAAHPRCSAFRPLGREGGPRDAASRVNGALVAAPRDRKELVQLLNPLEDCASIVPTPPAAVICWQAPVPLSVHSAYREALLAHALPRLRHSPQLVYWESQSAAAVRSPTGQRYPKHRENGTNVLLLVREAKSDAARTQPHLFIGLAATKATLTAARSGSHGACADACRVVRGIEGCRLSGALGTEWRRLSCPARRAQRWARRSDHQTRKV